MARMLVMLGLLALSLATSTAQAQTAPSAAPPQPAVNAVDPAAVQALTDMGTYLQTLKRFQVTTELTGERVLADGQKLQHIANAKMDVARPNRIRAYIYNARSERDIIYDGKTVTLFTPGPKYFSTVEFTENLYSLIQKLEARYGVEFPLADLFLYGTPAAPLDRIESAMNAGQDFVGGEVCDHYAFREGAVDWQIWIATGGKPLPRKLVITSRLDEARPQSVSLVTWNLKPTFNDTVFKFVPPAGAIKVELVPVKTN